MKINKYWLILGSVSSIITGYIFKENPLNAQIVLGIGLMWLSVAVDDGK